MLPHHYQEVVYSQRMKSFVFLLGLITLVISDNGVDPEAGMPAVKLC